METERDHGDVPCLSPVHFLPSREPLVDKVPSGEETTVQRNIGDPGKPTKHPPHYFTVTAAQLNKGVSKM